MRLRFYYAILLSLTIAFTLYEELHLRRILFRRPGVSTTIAGSLPNFLAVLVLSFLIILLRDHQNIRDHARAIVSVVAGLILYEIAQIWMPNRVFDWNDVAASILGGLCTFFMVRIPLLFLPGNRRR